MRRRIYKG